MRAARSLLAAAVAAVMLATFVPTPSHAQQAVELSTPYPAVAIEAGESTTFDVTVLAPTRRRVDLAVTELPEGWSASLRGGGFNVEGVSAGTDPTEAPAVQLEVEAPAEAAEDVHQVAVTGTGPSGSSTLVFDLRIAEVVPGGVSLEADFDTLEGAADSDFRFDLTLSNDTPEELTFNLSAEAPPGWQVSPRPALEERARTVTIEGGGSESVVVEATPPDRAEAGEYPIGVRATGGGRTAEAELTAQVTGRFEMTLTTADERLNIEATAGGATEVPVVVRNDGSAPLADVSLSASPPRDWEVDFSPSTISEIAPGQSAEATATVTPAGEALAGDYIITFRASSEGTTAEADVRTAVQTSRWWGLLGVVLILLAAGGLFAMFRRFGRR